MKKLIPVLTGAIMLLSLAACGSRTAAPEATTAPAAAGGKTLVVYFSATGSTKTAAEAIRRDRRRSAGARTGRAVHERRPGLQQHRQPRLARA